MTVTSNRLQIPSLNSVGFNTLSRDGQGQHWFGLSLQRLQLDPPIPALRDLNHAVPAVGDELAKALARAATVAANQLDRVAHRTMSGRSHWPWNPTLSRR